jgi:2-polyprenyl-6-hydroxyphenyl methylase/3-demethylubiquinone-9 3-methyltransferase
VGGYPYEYATSQAVIDFVLPRGYQLQRSIPAQVPTGCNEFVFTRQQT